MPVGAEWLLSAQGPVSLSQGPISLSVTGGRDGIMLNLGSRVGMSELKAQLLPPSFVQVIPSLSLSVPSSEVDIDIPWNGRAFWWLAIRILTVCVFSVLTVSSVKAGLCLRGCCTLYTIQLLVFWGLFLVFFLCGRHSGSSCSSCSSSSYWFARHLVAGCVSEFCRLNYNWVS